MGLTIRRTGAEDYGQHIKALICGDPGAGKTLISSTFPNPLYASAEGGLMSVADRDVPYVEVRSSDDLMDIKKELVAGNFDFPVDTLVIDTIDEVQNILKNERMHEMKRSSFELKDWQWLDEQMRAFVRGFRNMPIHVVFTCHIKDVNDGDTGKIFWMPKLQGGISGALPGYVDLSLLIDSAFVNEIQEDGKLAKVEKRVLKSRRTTQYPFLKDRSGKLPETFEVNFQDDFARLHETIFGGIKLASRVEYDLPDHEEDDLDIEDVSEEVASKSGVKSRNKLPEGVVAIPKGFNTNLFCVKCGEELEDERRAELSKIRHKKVLCGTHYEEGLRDKKGSK